MKTIVAALFVIALIIVGCTTPQRVENPPGSGNFTTNHIVDPRLTTGLETARIVNDATSGVNPVHGLITILLGATSAVAGWVATRKNQQAAQSANLLKVVVQGVESSGDSDVKKTIQKHSVKSGVEGALSSAVAKITSGV